MTKEEGTVAYLNEVGGYGFIEIQGREKSVFFHAKDLKHIPFEKIRVGDTVVVEGIRETAKGFNAGPVYLVS